MMMVYCVNEVFQTIQGEGFYTGTPAIFLRLQGCDVGCSWCDTKHTWEIDPKLEVAATEVIGAQNEAKTWANYSANHLVDMISSQPWQASLVVITGGEPCMFDLKPLTQALEDKGYQVQIETSGTYPVLCSADAWVTVSPKLNMKGKKEVLLQALERANEIKYPVARKQHIDQLEALLDRLHKPPQSISLQPISQQQSATQLAIETCMAKNWRLSVQMHKYLQID
jgi:7-carboxy-7-deazaguanine synthase